MSPRPEPQESPAQPDAGESAAAEAPPAGRPTPAAAAAVGSLADLPVAGLTRRRIAFLLAALVAAWLIVLFARQVSDAQAASARADDLRVANAQLAVEVEALERELDLIGNRPYIVQQARAYRLGAGRDIPFTLAADAPALPRDAPGQAAVRLGAHETRRSPLEAWLDVLFGSGS